MAVAGEPAEVGQRAQGALVPPHRLEMGRRGLTRPLHLALAQIAALGATYAVFLGHDPDEPFALVLSLLFTAAGAFAFAALRQYEDRVPQEALIGIAYAVSAALGILLIELAADPHGAEKLQHLLVGNIVWVRWSEIGVAAAAIFGVGGVHAIFCRRFLRISLEPEHARRDGINLAVWDLVFYLTFGIVLTAIVSIVGVLLVFSFLVIPAVVARLFVDGTAKRLGVAWALGAIASVAGVSVSYEHSTGPIIVAILGAVLLMSMAWLTVSRAPSRGVMAAKLAGGAVVLGLVLFGASKVPAEGHEHHHDEAAAAEAAPATAAAAASEDPLDLLAKGVELARNGDAQGLEVLASLTKEDAPFIRMEAHDRLAAVAGSGAPAYDPMARPDSNGLWSTWAASPPEGWQAQASQMAMPLGSIPPACRPGSPRVRGRSSRACLRCRSRSPG